MCDTLCTTEAVVLYRFYGLSVWFPDVIKHLQADDYASRVKIHDNERIEDFTFNFTLENQIHTNGVFLNDRLKKPNIYICTVYSNDPSSAQSRGY